AAAESPDAQDQSTGQPSLGIGLADLALGVLIECAARGIRVPEDVGICGFNDLEFSAFTQPTLTTVQIPRYEIGYRVADMLLRAVRDEPPGEDKVDCGFSIIPRGSTR
ncbi:substrate-binding domain-containing protein, partial [Rhizobium ruizarguesonis]